MKNRRNIIVAFLLCACLIVGVGYASLTDVLDITGSADVNLTDLEKEYENEIYFSAAVANDGAPNTASVNADNNDKASFSAKSLLHKGETTSFTFTITNDSQYDVNVTPKLNATLGNTNTTYFDITSDWNGATKTIPAGQTATYTLTVELLEDPTEAVSGSFLVELVATAVDGPTQP